MLKYPKIEIEHAKELLREWVKPGDTVYTINRSVSRSGMQRNISVIAFPKGYDRPVDMDYQVTRATGYSQDKRSGAVRVNGCGMDMHWALVHDLSRVLYPEETEANRGLRKETL